MKCTICGKEIVLSPPAKSRAELAKQRGMGEPYTNPSYYTGLFTTHAECFIAKREEDTINLIRRTR
jgi:hypothetical protein